MFRKNKLCEKQRIQDVYTSEYPIEMQELLTNESIYNVEKLFHVDDYYPLSLPKGYDFKKEDVFISNIIDEEGELTEGFKIEIPSKYSFEFPILKSNQFSLLLC